MLGAAANTLSLCSLSILKVGPRASFPSLLGCGQAFWRQDTAHTPLSVGSSGEAGGSKEYCSETLACLFQVEEPAASHRPPPHHHLKWPVVASCSLVLSLKSLGQGKSQLEARLADSRPEHPLFLLGWGPCRDKGCLAGSSLVGGI